MGRVISSASTSLDGFVAGPDDEVGPLFDWYEAGDRPWTATGGDMTFHLSAVDHDYWTRWVARLGALVVGRRLFDITDGWKGTHPLGVPVVVLTHSPPDGWGYPGGTVEFVTTGIHDAVARARQIAGDADVGVAAGEIASQCIAEGLLDEVAVDLVPCFLGVGRPYFTEVAGQVVLADPTTVVEGERVTHLVYPVRTG
jgi:dihydrofolate reductase